MGCCIGIMQAFKCLPVIDESEYNSDINYDVNHNNTYYNTDYIYETFN